MSTHLLIQPLIQMFFEECGWEDFGWSEILESGIHDYASRMPHKLHLTEYHRLTMMERVTGYSKAAT